jgi:hypothetical protein
MISIQHLTPSERNQFNTMKNKVTENLIAQAYPNNKNEPLLLMESAGVHRETLVRRCNAINKRLDDSHNNKEYEALLQQRNTALQKLSLIDQGIKSAFKNVNDGPQGVIERGARLYDSLLPDEPTRKLRLDSMMKNIKRLTARYLGGPNIDIELK